MLRCCDGLRVDEVNAHGHHLADAVEAGVGAVDLLGIPACDEDEEGVERDHVDD